jgi:hypothetical protein
MSASGTGDDETGNRICAFLRAQGGAEHAHAGERSLLDHLVGTYDIVRRWGQPSWLQYAALLHSVYGTDVHRQQLLTSSRRDDVAELAGARAERLAYLFCVTPRRLLFAGTHRWASNLPGLFGQAEEAAEGQPGVTREELDALVLLHMANIAEQARAADGSPGAWLVALRDLAELLIDSDAVSLPPFVAGLGGFSEADESAGRRAYRAGSADAGPTEERVGQLALAGAVCPVVAEPCVWQAYLAWSRGDFFIAANWARCALGRLAQLGTNWDKRLTYSEWLDVAQRLARPALGPQPPPAGAVTHPRALYETVTLADSGPGHVDAGVTPPRVDSAAPMTARYQRYVEALAHAGGPGETGIYPDLASRPWYEPSSSSLARYLETHEAEIRDEILALDSSRFHRESERIDRSGDWDVAFFYERGRRHDDVCDACPVTARGIENHDTMRTLTGLIYVSRMRAGTHIAPHRGPTNLRLRCHLGITVPSGDCAIRVGDEVRPWSEGNCLLFDDSFEHEAWNHTEEDRTVLIVDIWHPALSPSEIRLLSGLHRYADVQARQLNRYWLSNRRARAADGRSAERGLYQSPPPSPPSPPQSPPPSPPSPPQPPPSPPSPPSPSPSPSPPKRSPTTSPPMPSPAPSAEPTSSADSSPPPPKPLK